MRTLSVRMADKTLATAGLGYCHCSLCESINARGFVFLLKVIPASGGYSIQKECSMTGKYGSAITPSYPTRRLANIAMHALVGF